MSDSTLEQTGRQKPIRVLVVDDSPTVQQLLVAILQAEEGIQVVGVASNGEEAIRLARSMRPDVVTMDVRMPKMDGLEATRNIMREAPTRIVIVAGSVSPSDMDLTFEALKAGAVTVVSKPGPSAPEACATMVQAVRLMAGVPVVHHWGRLGRAEVIRPPAVLAALKTDSLQRPQIIGMAASTGGPAALAAVLGALPADFPVPILIVQHVTQGFASGLANWLNSQTPLQVSLAKHDDLVAPGKVLLAPDDHHLVVGARGVVALTKEEPYRGLRPSANYLFTSLGQSYGPRAVGVILTGMGDDGADGLCVLRQKGGVTIAQDEESCVVYGMPREAAARQAVAYVLPLKEIATTLDRLVHDQGRRASDDRKTNIHHP